MFFDISSGLLTFGLVVTILWVLTLVYQVKKKRWVSFVLTLIFGWIGMLVFWILKGLKIIK